ncbi:MAG: hypothetical protein HYW77_00615 [Parcubacteria group bacterium]|nr:hypothetical protein [Parcubacteria group bacterium]
MPEIENQINVSQNQNSNKKTFLILLIIVLIGLAAFVFRSVFVSRFKKQPTPMPSLSSPSQVLVSSLPLNIETIKKEFPSNVPIEAGVQILGSSKQKYLDSSKNLVSVQFVSKKTLNENLAIYENFLKTSAYQITNKTSDKDFVALYGVGSKNETFVFSASMDLQKNVLVNLVYSL